ncbi:hypothetical protein G6011_04827 [Alternaria panax]|uniref:Uncharacterized protein n=1 Tax=Alternaria panax TaxID=48097 RepID=A0AAD4IHQ7_9PLEO|nr:hypothetical protein G6011_04827 [Alternaria panax]
MPDTPDDAIFIAAIIVAFFSGALLIDWIRSVRDVGKQKQWYDAQMKALERGFSASKHLPTLVTAIQSSVNALHGKADDSNGRFEDKSSRIDEISLALDHIHKHQHQDFDIKKPSRVQPSIDVSAQDFRELLDVVQTLQDTLTSTNKNTTASPQLSSTGVPTKEINPAFSDIPTLSTHPESPPLLSKLDQYAARLQAESSDLQSQCESPNEGNRDLKQSLEAAQKMNVNIRDNATTAADKHWKRLLDNETRLNRIQRDSLQKAQGEMQDLSKQMDELAHTNTELREEIMRVAKSAEEYNAGLEELRRGQADRNLDQKHLEEDYERLSSDVETLKSRLWSAEIERSKKEAEIKSLSSLHESTQVLATTKDATINELNKRLAHDANQLNRISTERGVLVEENKSMDARIRTLEKKILQDKQQIDCLTNEVDAATKQKEIFEQELEELDQARKALEHNTVARGSSSSDSPEQTKEFEPDADRQTVPSCQSLTSETASQGELGQESAKDSKIESTTPVAVPVDTYDGKDPEPHTNADEGSNNATQETPMPGDSATESQRASDDGKSEDVSDPIVSSSKPDTAPATPPATSNLVKDYCRGCKAYVLLKTFTKRDGTRHPDWHKHHKETQCRIEMPH